MQKQIEEIKNVVTANRNVINTNSQSNAKLRNFAVNLLDFTILTMKPIPILDPFLKPLEKFKNEL